jgi:hypothetical protein
MIKKSMLNLNDVSTETKLGEKERYVRPVIEVIELEVEDFVAVSGDDFYDGGFL